MAKNQENNILLKKNVTFLNVKSYRICKLQKKRTIFANAKNLYFNISIMKKLIITTIATTWLLLAWNTYAGWGIDVTAVPYTTTSLEASSTLSELTLKYDIILRNNNITPDYEYNNRTYFTTKIKTDNIVIPDEIMQKAKKIYFLVEEWYPMMLYKSEMSVTMDAVQADPVTKEYNYRKVDYVDGKAEYIFNNTDLVKDFWKDEYKSVNITLVAEISDTEKVYLSNMSYINIANKQAILDQLRMEKDPEWTMYFWYYDNQTLGDYLDKLWEKMSREDYKKALTNAWTKLKELIKKNEAVKTEMLNSITTEDDFEKNVDKYVLYTETNTLLRSISDATKGQLQKLRAYEVIDGVFGK